MNNVVRIYGADGRIREVIAGPGAIIPIDKNERVLPNPVVFEESLADCVLRPFVERAWDILDRKNLLSQEFDHMIGHNQD